MSDRRVLVLYTGGTMGMVAGPRGWQPAKGELQRQLRQRSRFHHGGDGPLTLPPDGDRPGVCYDVLEYEPLLDSSNLAARDWVRLAEDVARHDEYDAFVVVHGTDTMAYSASALSFMLRNLKKTVIFTGSQIPIGSLRTDAVDNLLGALILAATYDLPEVGLYFRGRLFRGNRTTKTDAKGLDAFASPNLRPLATMDVDVDVDWGLVRPTNAEPLEVHPIHNPHVACITLFPGMTATTLERMLQPPLKGLVLLTYGAGNAPDNQPDFLRVLRHATDQGQVIVNATQCLRGTVRPDYAAGKSLEDAGLISALDMTAEAALTKLAYLLSLPDLQIEQIRSLIQTDLRGELTSSGPRERAAKPAAKRKNQNPA